MHGKTVALWVGVLGGAALIGGGIGYVIRVGRQVEAARPTLTVERVFYEDGFTYAVVKLENYTSSHVDFETVGLSCTFFSGNQVLDDAGTVSVNLKDRGTSYEKVTGPRTQADRADCRVTWVKLA